MKEDENEEDEDEEEVEKEEEEERGRAAINIPPYVKHITAMKTRNSDPMKFIPVQTSCDEYKYSFWSRTMNDWNSLPSNIINMTSLSNFKAAVNNYTFA